MTRTNLASRPTMAWAAATSSLKSYQRRPCQSDCGLAMALTWAYAVSGKKAGPARPALPVVTASHRSWTAFWNGVVVVLGNRDVCGRTPAPGATGSAMGAGVPGASGDPPDRAGFGCPAGEPVAASALAARW